MITANPHIADAMEAAGEVFELAVPVAEPVLDLVVVRPAPLTVEQLAAASDRAVNAAKPSLAYLARSDHFALEQQQRRGGL